MVEVPTGKFLRKLAQGREETLRLRARSLAQPQQCWLRVVLTPTNANETWCFRQAMVVSPCY